jgi:FO synthase
VKMGREGVAACLGAGVNDLGGSLMNESITRAAGSAHGQEWAPALMEAQIRAAGRRPRMRTTLYADVAPQRRESAFAAAPLAEVHGASAAKQQRSKRIIHAIEVEAAPAAIRRIPPPSETSVYESVVLMAACN